MVARLDGRDLKGSDFLWRACTRALQPIPPPSSPRAGPAQPDAGLDALFHDDAGNNPLPMWPEHLDLIRGYARWFADQASSPAAAAAPGPDRPRPR
jgi:hypothetical protein